MQRRDNLYCAVYPSIPASLVLMKKIMQKGCGRHYRETYHQPANPQKSQTGKPLACTSPAADFFAAASQLIKAPGFRLRQNRTKKI